MFQMSSAGIMVSLFNLRQHGARQDRNDRDTRAIRGGNNSQYCLDILNDID